MRIDTISQNHWRYRRLEQKHALRTENLLMKNSFCGLDWANLSDLAGWLLHCYKITLCKRNVNPFKVKTNKCKIQPAKSYRDHKHLSIYSSSQVFRKIVILKISPNSPENTCTKVSFLKKLQDSSLQLYLTRDSDLSVFLRILPNF